MTAGSSPGAATCSVGKCEAKCEAGTASAQTTQLKFDDAAHQSYTPIGMSYRKHETAVTHIAMCDRVSGIISGRRAKAHAHVVLISAGVTCTSFYDSYDCLGWQDPMSS